VSLLIEEVADKFLIRESDSIWRSFDKFKITQRKILKENELVKKKQMYSWQKTQVPDEVSESIAPATSGKFN